MTKIQLAFVVEEPEAEQLPSLICEVGDLPNKIGGLPIWLDPFNPLEEAKCEGCDLQMPLLMQIYCPEDYPENAFHRVMYVFCCRNGKCHSREAIKVYRSQLELKNKIYDMEGHFIKTLTVQDGALVVNGEKSVAGFCKLCGLKATKVCGQCSITRYCSVEHQRLDWKQGEHKEICGTKKEPTPLILKWLDSFRYPEHELEEEEEPEKKQEEVLDNIEERLKPEAGDEEIEDEEETETDVDKAFLKFQKRLMLAPSQVMRYGRVNPDGYNEEPLWASDSGKPERIPPCEHCKSQRSFEFQITPQLLTYLQIDHKVYDSLDWGTLLIYTCQNHCDAANGSYAQEFVFNQKYSSAGLGDSIRQTLAQNQ